MCIQMQSFAPDDYRRKWMKLQACDMHTWPQATCQYCWSKIMTILERECFNDWKKEGKL